MKKQLFLYVCLFFAATPLLGQDTKENKIRTVRKTPAADKRQEIRIIEQNENFVFPGQQEEFYYIENDFSPQDASWVASMEGFCLHTKKSNLETLFYGFWEKANALGANAFFIDGFEIVPDTVFVTISIFNLTEKELDDNYALYSCNEIYILGDLVYSKSPKGKSVKVNNEKITIYPYRYYVYQSDIGEKVNVSIGGIFGSGYTRKGEEGKVSIYLSLGGFNVRPGVGISGGVGLRFSAGEIYPLDMNFGQFLTEILEEQE